MTITPEESEAYKWWSKTRHPSDDGQVARLVNALRRHVAAEMRLEFEKEHRVGRMLQWCITCPNLDKPDPRHNYTDSDWDRAADKALMGEATK